MKKSSLTAVTLRNILALVFIAAVIAVVGGFYYAQQSLKDYASVGSTSSNASGVSSQDLKQLQNQIAANQQYSDKALAMISSATGYQDKAMSDITKYAVAAGVSITAHNFDPPSSSSVPIAGVTSTYVNVSVANPVPLVNILKFIKLIETNLPKMQLTGINMAYSSKDKVVVAPLNIELFAR